MYNLNRMEYLNTTFYRMQEIKEQVKECYEETVRWIQNVEHSTRQKV